MKKSIICIALATALGACTTNGKMESRLLANMDTAYAPGTDFFEYATGGWRKANPITDEYARYGQFDALRENNREQLKELVLEQAAKKSEPGSNAQKVGDLYNMVMDSTRRNSEGVAPIKPLIEEIASLKNRNDIALLLAKNCRSGIGGMFGTGIGTDIMDSDNNQLGIYQGGISLPEKEYYSDSDEVSENIRTKFCEYVVNMFKIYGFSEEEANKNMQAVMKIETRIAAKHLSRVERRNPINSYHKITFEELKKQTPGFDWDAFYNALGINSITELNLAHPEAIKEAVAVINDTPMDELVAYLQWRAMRSTSNELSDDIEAETFAFYGTVLSGKKVQQPRWKRALSAVDGALGDIIGELYVAKHFPPAAKERMILLVKNLQIALGQRIDAQEWMSDVTKKAAHEKLNTFTVKIGYPDKWEDYTTMEIDPNLSYYENCHNASMWHQKKELAKWGKPVDKSEWGMTPQTVNAYYSPLANEIVFPAGILQAPFFDAEASDAENYGGIGVVIGHEMIHGFDDQGCNFDAEGNMKNWWTAEDAEAFKKLSQVLVDQFNQVEILPGLFANGEYTLGENIADQGGLRVSRTAFLDSQKNKGVDINSEEAKIEGYTPMQVFYMNYANLWAQNIREAEIRSLTSGDVHSLGINRVNVTLKNIQPFIDAFGIKEGDKMFRPQSEQVIIW